MIWIILTVTFYITSGLFFTGFCKVTHMHFNSSVNWGYFNIFVWTIFWLPIVYIMSALMAYSGIREWLHG